MDTRADTFTAISIAAESSINSLVITPFVTLRAIVLLKSALLRGNDMAARDIEQYELGLHDALMGIPMMNGGGWAYEAGYYDGIED